MKKCGVITVSAILCAKVIKNSDYSGSLNSVAPPYFNEESNFSSVCTKEFTCHMMHQQLGVVLIIKAR